MKFAVFSVVFGTLLALCAAGPISVDPNGGGGGGLDLSGTELTAKFCQAEGKRCALKNIEKPQFAGTARQCLIRCAKNKRCLSAFYSNKKDCTLLGDRCDNKQLKRASGGLDLYRLMRGEACPKGRPAYSGPNVKYTNSFCMSWGKRCPDKNIYLKPQNIQPFMECLKKCARIKTCGMVDFRNNKCEPKELSCDESELVDDANAQNFLRLKEGVTKCPKGRSPPSATRPPAPPKVPVRPPVISVPAPDKYCVRPFTACMFRDIQAIPFVFSLAQCQNLCDSSDICRSLHHDGLGMCWLKGSACTNDEIVAAGGTDSVRVNANFDCSVYEPKHKYCDHHFSTCMFGDVAMYLFVPNLERCKYYCDFKDKCNSLYFDEVTKTCFLKNTNCPGWFHPLLPAIGTYSKRC